MNDLNAYVADITSRFDTRPAGSSGEEGAALYVADTLDALGIPVNVEPFETSGSTRWHTLLSYAIIGLPGILIYVLTGMQSRIILSVVAFVGLAFLILNSLGKNPLVRVLAHKHSRNIVARYVPQAQSPVTRRKKIVIVAHADAPKSLECSFPFLASKHAFINYLLLMVSLVIVVSDVLTAFFDEMVLISLILNIVLLVLTLVLVVRLFARQGVGANGNASGMAALLGVAEKVVSIGLTPVSEFPAGAPTPAASPELGETRAFSVVGELLDAQADECYGVDTERLIEESPRRASITGSFAAIGRRFKKREESISAVPFVESEPERVVESELTEFVVVEEETSVVAQISERYEGRPIPRSVPAVEESASEIPVIPVSVEPVKQAHPSWWRKVEGEDELGAEGENDDAKSSKLRSTAHKDERVDPDVRSRFADAPAYRDTEDSESEPEVPPVVVRSRFADAPIYKEIEKKPEAEESAVSADHDVSGADQVVVTPEATPVAALVSDNNSLPDFLLPHMETEQAASPSKRVPTEAQGIYDEEPSSSETFSEIKADQTKSLLDLPVIGLSTPTGGAVSPDEGFAQRGLDVSALDESEFLSQQHEAFVDIPANATGTFAALGVTGIMEPVSIEKLEEYAGDGNLYISDVDDSDFSGDYNDAAYGTADTVEVPTSRFGALFGRGKGKQKRRKNNKGQEETSSTEWLGLDGDFSARRAGADIGSWKNFDDDDWRGGAYGAALSQDNHAAISLLSTDLLDKEIWFVVTGASTAEHTGMKSFIDHHAAELRSAFIVNVEDVGAGILSSSLSEGQLVSKQTDRRLQKLVRKASDRLHMKIPEVSLSWRRTDASIALDHKLRAISLVGLSAGVPAQWRAGSDHDDIVDSQNIDAAVSTLLEMIKNV